MLQKMFDIFETTEVQLTAPAIFRLRWCAVLGIFAMPQFAVLQLSSISGGARIGMTIFAIICLICMLYCALTRLGNRLWVPEKYLDESEIERKRRSASLTFQTLVFALIAIIIGGVFFVPASGEPWPTVSMRAVVFIFGILLCGVACLQIAIAAWMTEPLNDGPVETVAADKRYIWIALTILITCFAIGGMLGYFSA